MNVQTMTIEREVAEQKLAAYRTQLQRKANEEFEQIAAGYREALLGRPLITLSDALRAAGDDDRGRPNIAVARADRRQVQFRGSFWDESLSTCWFDARLNRVESATLNIRVDLPGRKGGRRNGFALVPLVPADVLESIGGRVNLRRYFVMWEVEQWSDRPILAGPDRDPYLLKHLGGDLYAVMAEWELTDLERAVMVGRREAPR